MKFLRCPRCKSAHIAWTETHIGADVYVQDKNGVLGEGSGMGNFHPDSLYGQCADCDHIWKPRTAQQITCLPNFCEHDDVET